MLKCNKYIINSLIILVCIGVLSFLLEFASYRRFLLYIILTCGTINLLKIICNIKSDFLIKNYQIKQIITRLVISITIIFGIYHLVYNSVRILFNNTSNTFFVTSTDFTIIKNSWIDDDISEDRDYNKERISFDFKDDDLEYVFGYFAYHNPRIIFRLSTDIKCKVTLWLNDVPWNKALEALLVVYDLEYMQKGNVITIMTINDLFEAPVETEVYQLQHLSCDQAKKIVDSMLTSNGKVQMNEKLNIIIVTDTIPMLNNINHIIKEKDIA